MANGPPSEKFSVPGSNILLRHWLWRAALFDSPWGGTSPCQVPGCKIRSRKVELAWLNFATFRCWHCGCRPVALDIGISQLVTCYTGNFPLLVFHFSVRRLLEFFLSCVQEPGSFQQIYLNIVCDSFGCIYFCF